jgi:UDP-N-acetylmuramate--alanine ligase
MNNKSLQSYYFIGIGGMGMSALARLCLIKGHRVFGYDVTPSQIINDLISEGAQVIYDLSFEALPIVLRDKNIEVVYTAAISRDHPQLKYFFAQGNNVRKRAVFLAELTSKIKTLAISGTHGKTTTSAFLTHIFSETSQEFTSIMGGFFKNQKSNLIVEGSDFMIVEADEYDRSFLQLHPSIACITSMDADHLDIYETNSSFSEAFIKFSSQVSQALVVAYGLPIKGITYGIDVPADYRVENIIKNKFGYNFNIITPLRTYENVYLNQLGLHNILNALCAIAMADQIGVFTENSIKALTTFPGVQRRMNLMKYGDAIIIDDYAHHPREIENVLNTLKGFYPEHKNCVIFQPHLFSRTQDFMNEFALVLSEFDEVVLLDIYPARELPISGISAQVLLDKLNHSNKKLILKSAIKESIDNSNAGLFAFLGAGDIGLEVEKLKINFTAA